MFRSAGRMPLINFDLLQAAACEAGLTVKTGFGNRGAASRRYSERPILRKYRTAARLSWAERSAANTIVPGDVHFAPTVLVK